MSIMQASTQADARKRSLGQFGCDKGEDDSYIVVYGGHSNDKTHEDNIPVMVGCNGEALRNLQEYGYSRLHFTAAGWV
jgi:hypothetical protein